jgi:thiamine-phosphate pyrophosphorylase
VKGFYFVTDAGLSRRGIIADVRDAVAAGVCAVQYRRKDGLIRQMIKEAAALREICCATALLINDRVDVCLASGADGVHLGQEDMPCAQARKIMGKGKIIGVTVHTVDEALAAERDGADYLGVSPIFATGTKNDAGTAAGLQLIKDIHRHTQLPLVAIGGITLSSAPEVIAAGADCLCAISAVLSAEDVRSEIAKFQKLYE